MSNRPAICVVGLGYVGCVEAACLSARGFRVVGVDRRSEIVEALDRGVAPIQEPQLELRIETARSASSLRATTRLGAAVVESDLSLICVGTPADTDGQLLETDVLDAVEAVARAVPEGRAHTIVIRSTVPPGLYQRARARLQRAVGGALGSTIYLALNPEFLREGSAVDDRESPELVVYATEDEAAVPHLEALYADVADRVHRTDPASAEMLKLVCNTWHALKVSFANEVARIGSAMDVDSTRVMALLCRDTKLNTSAAYLRPGLPFGGACLVKDVASLSSSARALGVSAPVIASVLGSNRAHLDHLVAAVLARNPRRVAVVGVGFKPGAADVRDSAPVKLVRALLDVGVEVQVADSGVIDSRVPPLGLAALEVALDDSRAHACATVTQAVTDVDVIVVGHPSRADRDELVRLAPRCVVLDGAGELTRMLSSKERESLSPVVVF